MFLSALLCVGGHVWALEPNGEGVYEIGSASDLVAFAGIVNDGDATANAILTADIDMTEADISVFPIGTPASGSGRYSGTFDGQGHKISNFKLINKSAATNFGMFNTGSGVTLKNFWLDSSCEIEGKELVGLIGRHDGAGTFENIGNAANVTGTNNNIGGLIGGTWGAGSGTTNPTTFRNCWTTGRILTTNDAASNYKDCGAITGWFNNGRFVFESCWSTADVVNPKGDNMYMFRNGAGAAFTYADCFCLNEKSTQANFAYLDPAAIASGELCFKLNGDQSAIAWYQKIGTDATPLPYAKDGATVYMPIDKKCDGTPKEGGEIVYSNESGGVQDDHSYVDGVCSVCGTPDEAYMTANTDGFYEISTQEELVWFAAMVSAGNDAIKGLLKEDVTLMAKWNTPIGTADVPFKGTFDGKGKTITGFDMEVSTGKAGLFGNISSATVGNFSIDGLLKVGGGTGTGAIGWAAGSTISDIHSTLAISTTADKDVHHVAGVLGSAQKGNIISGCSFGGTMKVTSSGVDSPANTTDNIDNFGGVVGYVNADQVYSCANYGKVEYDSPSCSAGGVVAYCNNGNFVMSNCLNTGEVKFTGEGTPSRGGAIIGRTGSSYKAASQGMCYYLEGSATYTTFDDQTENFVAVKADQLASGEVAYLLNQGAGEAIWYQTIGEDDYPVLDDARGYVGKIGEGGYGTLSMPYNVSVPEGVTAYTGVQDGSKVTLTEIGDVIPAKEGVVLKGEEGYYSFLATDAEAGTIGENDLIGTMEPFKANGLQYVLATVDGATGFYKVETDSEIPGNKAYIVPRTTAEGSVKSLSIVFGEATGIAEVESSTPSAAVIYDLSGRRVEKAVKGIYIINGKKVLK